LALGPHTGGANEHCTPELPVNAAIIDCATSSLLPFGANGAEFGCFAGKVDQLPNI
jgi:hypothetical protein